MRILPVILVTLAGAISVRAQPADSLGREWWTPGGISSLPVFDSLTQFQRFNRLSLDFDHTSSLFNWGGGSQIYIPGVATLQPGPSLLFSAQARSQLREDTHTRTNEGTAYLQSALPVAGSTASITATLFGTTYSLNQSPQTFGGVFSPVQRLSDGYALAGAKYLPTKDVSVFAGAGAAYKSFVYGRSSGSIIQVRGDLAPTEVVDGSYLDLGGNLDERRFPSLAEAARNDGAHLHYLTALGDGGSNDASASFLDRRQDFYFSVDSLTPYARQQRSEVTFELRDSLHYPIAPKLLDWFFDGGVIPKNITRKTNGIDFASESPAFLTSSTFLLPSTTSAFDLDLATGLQWRPVRGVSDTTRIPVISGSIRFTENSETNNVSASELPFASPELLNKLSDIFDATSFDRKQSAVSFDAYVPAFSRDAILTSLSSRLLRYDTPSSDNHDDRDELYLNAIVGYSHRFSSLLSGSAQVRLSRSHLVYLTSDRSAQNYVGKTISLLLSTMYLGTTLQHSISAEVFSNYAVYDFAVPLAELSGSRDYLIRGINAGDSILVSLGRFPFLRAATISIESNLNLRLYERGSYNAGAFSERPLLMTEELSGDLTLDVADRSTAAPVLVKLGARIFYQLRYAPPTAVSTGLEKVERIDRFGPLVVIVLDNIAPSGPRFYGSVWYSMLSHDQYDAKIFTSNRLIEGRLGARWTF